MFQKCLSVCNVMHVCVWGGWGSDLCGICSPCGNKSSASVIYFMCTEMCFVKSLGDRLSLEEPCAKLKKNCGKHIQ